MGAGAGQTGGGMQQMPQQTAMQQAMPVGAPAQSNKGGLGALAAQRQQAGQADPRLMAAMQAFQQQGGMPGAGMMPPGGMPTQQTQQAMMDQIRQTSPAIGMPGMPMPQVPGMAAPGGGLLPGAQLQYDPRKPDGMMPGVSPEDFQRITTMGGSINLPGGGTVGSAGGMMPLQPMPGIAAPGGVPVQRPLPVGVGGKGTGMPPPGMVNPPRPMPLPPGLNRPMPMPLPPGLNRPMPMPLPPGLNRPMPMPMPPGSMVNPPRPIGPKPVPQPVRSTPKPVNPRFNQIMPFLR